MKWVIKFMNFAAEENKWGYNIIANMKKIGECICSNIFIY